MHRLTDRLCARIDVPKDNLIATKPRRGARRVKSIFDSCVRLFVPIASLVILPTVVIATFLLPETYSGKVVHISDEDTLTLVVDYRLIDVRLSEIDTPEKGQPFEEDARKILADLTFDKQVRVEIQDTDQYGRAVGRVYVGGIEVNAEMVRRGYAWIYGGYPIDSKLYGLQAEAKAARRGLWDGEEHPIPPWEWKNGERTTRRELGYVRSP